MPAAETCTGDPLPTTGTPDISACSSISIVPYACLSNGDCFNLSPTKDNKSCVGTYCKVGSPPTSQSSTNKDRKSTGGSESSTSSSDSNAMVPDSGSKVSNHTPDWLNNYNTSDSKTETSGSDKFLSGKGTTGSSKASTGTGTTGSNGASSQNESTTSITTTITGDSTTTTMTKTTSNSKSKESSNKSTGKKSTGGKKSAGGGKPSHNRNTSVSGR